ncbi:MAG: hypothetical protein Q4G07_06990 [Oscillospiraceae bacterium]|nr:hypothetical protein [Oscillospiraceae bacterium]
MQTKDHAVRFAPPAGKKALIGFTQATSLTGGYDWPQKQRGLQPSKTEAQIKPVKYRRK